jgi:hypothetical protein
MFDMQIAFYFYHAGHRWLWGVRELHLAQPRYSELRTQFVTYICGIELY